jgi:hypothetical protein
VHLNRTAALAFAALAGLTMAAFLVLRQGDEASGGVLRGPPGQRFTIDYPNGWRALSPKELRALPGSPLGVLSRDDRKGLVVVSAGGRPARNFEKFSNDLTERLGRRLPDFQPQTASPIHVRAGDAFFYSYVRKREGTANAIVVVPAGRRSYVVNTVTRGGASSVAREVARLVLSFNSAR